MSDTVDSGDECPACGERRVDALEINLDGDTVLCLTCGRVYALPSHGNTPNTSKAVRS